jgi:hypothetical protein
MGVKHQIINHFHFAGRRISNKNTQVTTAANPILLVRAAALAAPLAAKKIRALPDFSQLAIKKKKSPMQNRNNGSL